MAQSAMPILNYISAMPTNNLQYKDGMLFLIGASGFLYSEDYHNLFMQSQYYPYPALDVVSLKKPENSFVVISRHSGIIEGVIPGTIYNGLGLYPQGTTLINVNDSVLILGDQSSTLYRFYLQNDFRMLEQVGHYNNISGNSILKEGDTLIVANRQGLFFYDISNLAKSIRLP